MARATNGIITVDDLRWMVTNTDLRWRDSSLSSSKKAVTKEVLLNAVYADARNLSTYTDKRLVPYQLVEVGLAMDSATPRGVGYTAGSFTFNVFAANTFSITDNAGWITCSPTSGVGTTSITVTYSLNPSGTSRSGTITISDSYNTPVQLVVNQGANPGIATDLINVRWSTSSGSACSAPLNYYYVPAGQSFLTATAIYADSSGLVYASDGWYSNGVKKRQWTAPSMGSAQPC